MFQDRVFQIAIVISLIVHSILLLQSPGFSRLVSNKNEQKERVVGYLKNATLEKKITNLPLKKEPLFKLPPVITAGRQALPLSIDKEKVFKKEQGFFRKIQAFNKPVLNKPDMISIKTKVTLPPLSIDKIDSPQYIGYQQIIREKIKRSAYQSYNGTETGVVNVSFIVANDGELKDLHVINEKSTSSSYLKDIALQSIKDASPFPGFPKELDYPSLPCELTIIFETE